jgi:hypothetical protein
VANDALRCIGAGVYAFVPCVSRVQFTTPLIACDISQIDTKYIFWYVDVGTAMAL